MLRAIQLALAGATLVVAVLAVAGLSRTPEAGVIADNAGGVVVHVDVGGPAWRNGVRAGHQVIDLAGSDATGGWRLVSSDGATTVTTTAASFQAAHANNLGWAIAGLALALIAAAVAFQAHAIAAVLTPLSVAAAALPLFLSGGLLWTIAGGVAVFAGGGLSSVAFAPGTWPAPLPPWTGRRVLGVGAAAAGLVLAVLWTIATAVAPWAFDTLDRLRWPATLVFTVIGLLLVVDVARVRHLAIGDKRPSFLDLAYGAVIVTVVLVLAIGFRVELLIVAAIGIAALVAFPFWRRVVVDSLDRLVTTGARREAAFRAVEDERGRLAREIHDDPLQELAGAIRNLEVIPGAEAITHTIRRVVSDLRDLATTLHPPVLEDLGLATAIEDLAQQVQAAPSTAVTIAVVMDDLTREEQPPGDVAIAAYRIAQEALVNAVRHSGGSKVSVSGLVSPDTILLEVADDGHGYSTDAVRTARARGHFGLDSMRERASAVGGRLDVASGAQGTRVSFQWGSSG